MMAERTYGESKPVPKAPPLPQTFPDSAEPSRFREGVLVGFIGFGITTALVLTLAAVVATVCRG